MKIRVWQTKIGQDPQDLFELDYPQNLNSFDAVMMAIPGGAYTTFRTYDHDKAIRFEEHLRRLEESARLAGAAVQFDPDLVRGYVRQIIGQYPSNQELRILVVIDLNENPGDIYYMSEYLNTPSKDAYRNGVKLITCNMRRQNPKAKLTRSIPLREEIRSGFAEDVHEALMVDREGKILEGLTSNFFALKGGELWTNAGSVLLGITRSLVIDTVKDAGLKMNFESVNTVELPQIKEAFITSASRAILPVVQIDNQRIGDGTPGVITRRLMGALEKRIQLEIEPI